MMSLSVGVVEDYNNNPSEISGSVEEAISIIKNKNEDDPE